MKFSALSFIGLIVMLAACDTAGQRSDRREALEEEMRNREPKKLSEAQIFDGAMQQGSAIADKAAQELLTALKVAVEKQGISGAVEFCKVQAIPLTASAAGAGHTNVKRTSLRLRNPENAPTETEQQLLEAYAYNTEHGLPMEPNVQRTEKQYLLYTRPIIINSPLCLQCHGDTQKGIAPETLQLIDSLYPQDEARGYQMGDVRGMWSIKLLQKDVVNAL